MSRKKISRGFGLFLIIAFIFNPSFCYGLPQGQEVVSGEATYEVDGNTMNVNVSTEKLIANYNSFSIAQQEAVNFYQPSSSSIALNRVTGVDPSSIMGTLTATGKIFLINPNGVLFGPNSVVDTNGMIASTLNITNEDFLNGRYTFYGSGGSVVNQGYISAPGGYVALLGSSVVNEGVIEASLGSVALASGEAITLNLDPQGLFSVVIDEATSQNLEDNESAVENTGEISADGGKVVLSAKALDNVFDKAINTSGIIEANAIDAQSGEVTLEANQRVNVAGEINAEGGTVTVDSEGADFSGSINAAEGIYNMNDGDTFVDGGIYSGGHTWVDNENIFVKGDVTGTNGDLTFTADNDNDNSGYFFQNFGLIKTETSGDINISGYDVLVRAIDSADNLDITAGNNLMIAPAWTNKQTIDINNSGSELTDYQIQFDISGLGNYEDIRFVNSEGNSLPYWVEGVESGTATVWVKADSIPNGSSAIYMYHGNASASDASNGEAVFDFFDDFEGSSLDTSKWTEQKLGGDLNVSGGQVTFQNNDGNDYVWIHSNDTFSYPVWLEAKVDSFNPEGATLRMGSSTGTILKPNGNYYSGYSADVCKWQGYRIVGDNSSSGWMVSGASTSDTNSIWSFTWNDTGSQIFNNPSVSLVGNDSTVAINDTHLYIGHPADGPGVSVVDEVRVRQYASVEPTTLLGADVPVVTGLNAGGDLTLTGKPTDVSGTPSIQAAIDAIGNVGGTSTINVGAEIYEEDLNLNKGNLTLTSISDAPSTTIKGGTIRFNADNITLDGFTIDNEDGTRAIGPGSSDEITIKDNIINNSFRGIQGDWYGRPTNLTIIGNIFNTNYGIAGTEDVTNLVIEDNVFNTLQEAIGLGEGVGVQSIVNNHFAGDGVHVKDYRASFDADLLEDILVDNIFDRAVVVRGSGIKVPVIFSHIQDGIEAAETGDTVDVKAGTYIEENQIVIDKDLFITGEDKEATIIKPAQDTGSSGNSRGWFLVESGNEFNLSDVTLDGGDRQIYQAIRSFGSGTIDNNIIKNIVYSPYLGTGVVVMGDDNMIISNNTLSNIGRIGIMAFGSGVTDAQIVGNTYIGKGTGDWLDYGIEIGGGATATISGNTILDCGFSDTDWASAGILVTDLYGPGTQAVISNNTLSDNSYGVYVGYDNSDESSVTANNNIFENNNVAIRHKGIGQLEVNNNEFSNSGLYHVMTESYFDGNNLYNIYNGNGNMFDQAGVITDSSGTSVVEAPSGYKVIFSSLDDVIDNTPGDSDSTLDLFHKGELSWGGFDTEGSNLKLTNAGDLYIDGDILTSGGDINLSVIEDPDLIIDALLNSGGGNVSLSAADHILIDNFANIMTYGGDFTASADTNNNYIGTYIMNPGSGVDTASGAVTPGSVLITGDDAGIYGTVFAGNADITIEPNLDQTIGLGGGFGAFNLGDFELDNLMTSGLLTVGSTNSDDMSVDSITQGSKTLKLVSGGNLTEYGTDYWGSDISVDHLILDITGDVGTTSNAIETEISLLEGQAGGLININEFDNLVLNRLEAQNIILNTNAPITLGGSILGNDIGGPNLVADTADLDAKGDIILDTEINNLWAYSATGDIYISEADAINLQNIVVDNSIIDITAGGTMEAIYVVNNGGTDDSDIYLTTTGGGSDGDIEIGNLVKATGLGDVILTAYDDVQDGRGTPGLVVADDLQMYAQGMPGGQNGGDSPMDGDIGRIGGDKELITKVNSITAVSQDEGEIAIKNIKDSELTLNNISTANDNVNIESDGDIDVKYVENPSGTVTLTSNTGSIYDVSAVNITTDTLTLNALNGSIGYLTTDINHLYAYAGDYITIEDIGSLVLEQVIAGGLLPADVNIQSAGDMGIGYVSDPVSVTLTSTGGAIYDSPGGSDDGLDIVTTDSGGELIFSAANGIGSGNAIETQVSNLQATNTDSGNIEIDNTGDLTVTGSGVVNTGDDVYLTTHSDLILESAIQAPGSLVSLDIDGFVDDHVGGYADILADSLEIRTVSGVGDTYHGANENLETQVNKLAAYNSDSGDININNTGALTVTEIDSTTGVINDGGNINLMTRLSGNHLTIAKPIKAIGNRVTLDINGKVIDKNKGSRDVTADRLELITVGGMDYESPATNLDLETKINKLAAYNSGSGVIDVNNHGGLIIGDVGNTSGVTNTAGSIDILATSPITVNSAVQGSSDIILTADNSGSSGDDLTLNADVTSTGSGSTIDLNAGDNFVQNSGTVSVTDGTIDIEADTESDSTGSISQTGGLIGSGSEELILSASEGIGSGNALDTQVFNLQATNNVSGNIDIDNTGGLNLVDLEGLGYAVQNFGAGNINISAASDINIDDDVIGGGDITLTATGDIVQDTYQITAANDVNITADSDSNSEGDFEQVFGLIRNTGTVNPGDINISGYDISVGALDSKGDVFLTAENNIIILPVVVGGEYQEIVLGTNDFIGGGTAQGWHADDYYWAYSLPFTFEFYGDDYDTVYVSSNGVMTFGSGNSSWGDSTSELKNSKMIAPLWEDWMTTWSGEDIFIHQPNSNSIAVRWNVHKWSSGPKGNFETVLYDNGSIKFNYGFMQSGNYSQPTVGISAGNNTDYLISERTLNHWSSSNFNNATSLLYRPASSLPFAGINAVGTADLDAGNKIIDQNDTVNTDITADTAILNAVNGIGSGDALETEIDTLIANNTTSGNIEVDNTGDLFAQSVVNSGDDIIIDVHSDLTLGTVQAEGSTVELTADEAIVDGDDTQVDILSADAILTAATGIGSGNAIETQVSNLQATNSTSGNIEIDNTGDLELKDLESLGYSVQNAGPGDIDITAHSSLTIWDLISASGGEIYLEGDNINQYGDIENTGSGKIELDVTTGDIIMHSSAKTSSTGTGTIDYYALSDVALNELSTGGDVKVIADTGAIMKLNSISPSTTNITADTASLYASKGIGHGQPKFEIQTDINTLIAGNGSSGGSGDIQIVNEGDLFAKEVVNHVGDVYLTVNSDLNIGYISGTDVNLLANTGGIYDVDEDYYSSDGLDILAENLTMEAEDSIGELAFIFDILNDPFDSDNYVGMIDTNVNSITARANDGNVFINEENGVTLTNVDALGSTALIYAGGDVIINEFSASGTGLFDPAIASVISGGQIEVLGNVGAENTTGAALVALLAQGDVDTGAGEVLASGDPDEDLVELLEDIFTIDIGEEPYDYTSGILLGSLAGDITLGNIESDMVLAAALGFGDLGNIYDTGDVAANYLLLLARNDIGTVDSPINTDVGILSAYSGDEGNIYINETDDIELGLYLPAFTEGQVGALGASVAANDGIINIVSGGDMIVNSVIAPRGGVYLEATGEVDPLTGDILNPASIYAGRGWCPGLSSDDLGILSLVSGFLMQPWPVEGLDYFSPVMIGGPDLPLGPNVIAGGPSYFSTPTGTIGIGYAGDITAENALSNPLKVCIQDLDGASALPAGFIPDDGAGLTLEIGGATSAPITLDIGDGNGALGLSGNIEGIVRPGTTAITGVTPSPDIDLGDITPPGRIFYNDTDSECCSPLIGEPALNLGPLPIWPEPALNGINFLSAALDNGLIAYYELLSQFRVTTSSPLRQTDYFAYHPITEPDSTAFEGIGLDAGAYEFIENNINLQQDLAPFFQGQDDEEEEEGQQT